MAHHKWKIEIPIYDYTLLVYTGDNLESIIKHYKLECYVDALTLDAICEDKIDGLAFTTNNALGIVVALDTPNSVIAHEAVHIINFIFEEIGYETRTDNDEAFTYFLTWLIDQIESKLTPKRDSITQKKKKKNKPTKRRVQNTKPR